MIFQRLRALIVGMRMRKIILGDYCCDARSAVMVIYSYIKEIKDRMHIKRSKKGFTLAELLIVVAIIGVLVAISIPIFSGQLEKAREATDAANIRSQYAEVLADAMMGGSVNKDHKDYAPVQLRQQKDEWQSDGLKASLKGVFGEITGAGPKAAGQAWVEFDAARNVAVLHYDDGSGSSGSAGSGAEGGGGTVAPTPTNPTKPIEPTSPTEPETTPTKPTEPETQAPTEPESTGPETSASYLTTQANKVAKEYPTGAFTGQLGNIYSYDNKLYVCTHAQQFLNGGSPTNWYNAQFALLDSTVTVLTSDNIQKNQWGGSYMNLKKGDIYQDGNVYYISMITGNWASAPDSSNIKSDSYPDGKVWVKINLDAR